ncbi:hypothetical protein F2Q68_00044007 [Brassica cretica]|uniref:Uncharacterized protein n=1 Tax=Brassica cretica TaxID=69181 RepID=A0A8S9LM30_BRACR|nr:hypothetical protein F2Q68_00044007 [Brassica cretica]
MKKGARIGAFPRGTIMRSSLTVNPTRSSQAIVPDIYGNLRFNLLINPVSIPNPNESLGVKVDPQRKQHHDSELLYLSDPCSRLCCIALEYMFGLTSTPDEKP